MEAFSMEEFKPFFGVVGVQTRMITDISVAGVVAILFTWLRCFGVLSDHAQLTQFRGPLFLFLPLSCLLIAILDGYIIGQATAGFYLEGMLGVNQSTEQPIEDLVNHFTRDYRGLLRISGMIQILFSIGGVLSLVGWYGFNILKFRITARSKTQ